ncbi:hypothetical protein QA612_19930 [Evansella sp. AB-P1]|nr:hypothetical protein [Evansella sp. AB-P1]MDG5789731.1 hypothetical protein [Evansella sp. AB-P1]
MIHSFSETNDSKEPSQLINRKNPSPFGDGFLIVECKLSSIQQA